MTEVTLNSKQKIIKYFILSLEALGFLVLAFLILFPFYPELSYKLSASDQPTLAPSIEQIKTEVANFHNSFPESDYSVSPNRLIISKIGVNAPIVEDSNEQVGLSRGAWRVPETSTPNQGGNTVITGHRFKYLPPNNVTFYLFHKLEKGDIVSVIWEDRDYFYEIKETKVVPATEISIMDQTESPILTLFTCDPIYSSKNRLVIIAEPIE